MVGKAESFPIRLIKPIAEEAQVIAGLAAIAGVVLLTGHDLTRAHKLYAGALTFTATLILLTARRALRVDYNSLAELVANKLDRGMGLDD